MKKTAFSLVELLVAMAVLTTLLVMLVGVVDSATKLWRMNENRVETLREARVAMHLLSGELRTILASTNPNYFFLDTNSSNSKLGFLTLLSFNAQETNSKSDLCAVGYFLAKGKVSDLDASASTTWNLYRYFLESNETFKRLSNNPANPGFWPSSEMTPSGNHVEILARNVRAFRVRAFQEGSGNWSAWTPSTNQPLPQLLEVEMEVMNTEATKRLSGELDGVDAQSNAIDIRTIKSRMMIKGGAQ